MRTSPKPGRRRIVAAAALVGLTLGLATPPALAATASSPLGYIGPIAGKNYSNQAVVSDQSVNYNLYAATRNNSRSGNLPTGYLGARPRLYKGTSLCSQGAWYYNTGTASGISTSRHTNGCGRGSYNSYGVTRHYNGNGYDSYYTFRSPSIRY
ncbi:hypothetical protein [Nocardiopsis chromatogenes]|uniref:hypothetical protein n=1 Tax=Nocardiopsis chromatogenes TaxID=280239 RepID=UPI00034A137B|nr:hypothetical protein [Nocardiopsis chromatogenes]